MASVELRELTKHSGPTAVVDNVSITIGLSSLFCLLGAVLWKWIQLPPSKIEEWRSSTPSAD